MRCVNILLLCGSARVGSFTFECFGLTLSVLLECFLIDLDLYNYGNINVR